VIFAVLALFSAAAAVDISGPAVISEPGVYRVTADITATNGVAVLTISSSDVVIEGGGHRIRGPGRDRDTAGIHVANAATPPQNVVVRDLTVEGCWYGVYLVGATGCRVERVSASGNQIGIGVNQGADGTVITSARCTGNGYGIALASSSGASIRDCVITGNSEAGLYLYGSGQNSVSNNRFENTRNVIFGDAPRPNTWNQPASGGSSIAGGSVLGGNLWLRPDGNGFSQLTPDRGDGICTLPYLLADGNRDELPLAAESVTPAETTVAPPPPSTTPASTDTPTPSPPTETPTIPPTETPTPPPTETPTIPPTETPTIPPTETPTLPPTGSPTPGVTPVPISGPTVIRDPGEYAIVNDITSTSSDTETIVIECSDVVLNGNNHVLSGAGRGMGGVKVMHPYGDVVRNVRISGVSITGFMYGVILARCEDCVVSDSRIRDSRQYGIGLSSAQANRITNNFLSNDLNVYFWNPLPNTWNTAKTPGKNIVGGPNLGGNFYGQPDGKGFSETHPDMDGDGICDDLLELAPGNTDALPLVRWYPPVTGTPTPTTTPGPTTPPTTKPTYTVPTTRPTTPPVTVTTVVPTGTTPAPTPTATGTQNVTVTVTPTPNVTVTVTPTGNVTPTVTPTPTPFPTSTIVPPVPPIPVPPSNVRPITGPIVITEPGYYQLQNDIVATDALVAIDIRSPDVIVNGNGHTISGNGLFNTYGVSAYRRDGSLSNVLVANLAIENFYYGCSFWNTHGGRIDQVTVRRTTYGILLQSSTGNLVHACDVTDNRQGGILLLAASDGNILFGNRADRQNWGVYLSSSERNRVISNRVEGNLISGITLFSAGNSTIANNYLNNTGNAGFEGRTLPNSWSVNLSIGQNIIGGRLIGGNYWAKPDGTGFSEITPDDDENGICNSPYNLAEGNVDQYPLHGRNASAGYIPITGPVVITEPGRYRLFNDIQANTAIGIEIRSSDVEIEGAGYRLTGTRSGGAGSPHTYGILAYNTSMPLSGVRIANLTVQGWYFGTSYRSVRDSGIDRINAVGNAYGVVLAGSSTVRVGSVTARGNEQGGVLLLEGSSHNAIENVTAEENLWGLYLSGSDANRITRSHIGNNTISGIDLVSSGENLIADNALINWNNTALQGTIRANTWHLDPAPGPNIIGGKSIGGNYYGSPDGRGFSDLVPDRDGDGYCDTPYEVGALNRDPYPLAPPWNEPYFPVTGPTVIASPGLYRLEGPITLGGAATGIEIRSSNVILDGGGYSVTGSRSANSNGILVSGQENVTIRNLTVSNCHTGVHLFGTNGSTVHDVTTDSNDFGVAVLESRAVRIEDSTTGSNTLAGVSFEKVTESIVLNVSAHQNKYGITLGQSANCVVRDSRTNENDFGVHLTRDQGSVVTNHTARDNKQFGVHVVDGSSGTQVDHGEAFKNGVGLRVEQSSGIKISGLNVSNSTGFNVTIPGDIPDSYRNISVPGYGIAVVGSPDVLLQSCIASNGTYGFDLVGSDRTSIAGCRADGNDYAGVLVDASPGSSVSDGRFASNGGAGVHVNGSDRCTLTGNTLTGNSVGLRLERARETRITGNTVEKNDWTGIALFPGADANTLSNNQVRSEKSAIRLTSSKENRIVNNVLIGTPPVDLSPDSRPNTWQSQPIAATNIIGGPSIGGNYYGRIGGPGFSNVTIDDNHDGFCDLPYTIGEGNVDTLPLAPWTAVPTPVPVIPAIGVDGRAGMAPYTVRFHDESTGHPTRWSWSFGDGATSAEQHPVHTYTEPGIYTVTLVAENGLGPVSKTERKFITVWGTAPSKPVANFIVHQARGETYFPVVYDGNGVSGTAPLSVRFNDTSVGYPEQRVWSFGDGATSHEQNPEHRYTSEGTYTVTLLVRNSFGEDTEVKTGLVTVRRYIRTMPNG